MATLTPQTLLCRAQLDAICAVTKDPTYHLHTVNGQVCLRRYRFPQYQTVSLLLSTAAMEDWLDGFRIGLEVGALTANRGI